MKFSSASIAAVTACAASSTPGVAMAENIIIKLGASDVAIPLSTEVSYDASQDENKKRPLFVSGDGKDVTLEGNIFRAIKLPYPLMITRALTLDLDFLLEDLEEVHAICLEKDLSLSSSKCFTMAHTQNFGYIMDPQATVGEVQHFSIPVGDYFTGSGFQYLVFLQDNDSSNRDTGKSTFSNIEITSGPDLIVNVNGDNNPVDIISQVSTSRNQDSTSYPLVVSADGSHVRLEGNMHRAAPFNTPVAIDANTNIEFDCTVREVRDVHGLCLTADISIEKYCLVVANTQTWGDYNLLPKLQIGETRHITVPIGLLWPSGNYPFLAFMQDNDTSDRSTGDVEYGNIALTQVIRPHLTIQVNGEDNVLSSSNQTSYQTGQDTIMNLLEFPDATSVTLKGNMHKAIKLSKPITITKATEIEFNFYVEDLEEVHALCLDDDLDYSGTCLMVAGTQSISWPKVTPQAAEGENRYYKYPIGTLFTGVFDYMVFMQDNDSSDRSTGISTFSNIKISERPPLKINIWGVDTPLFNHQQSYSGNQDTPANLMDVSHDGSKISMYGNSFKAFAFPSTLDIQDDVVLRFQLNVEEVTEITGICLDNDLSFSDSYNCFKLAGTQTSSLGTIIYRGIEQTQEGETKLYLLRLNEFFTGDANFLAFIHDNDGSDRSTGISHIKDLKIYNAQPSCLTSATFDFELVECTVNDFVSKIQGLMDLGVLPECAGRDAWEELLSYFNAQTIWEVSKKVSDICASAYAPELIPFSRIMEQEDQFIEEFFDGGNAWNYETDEVGGPNLATDAARADVVSGTFDGKRGIDFPDIHNFQECGLRAAMCCYVANRFNADYEPEDNSNACYMDFSKSRQSSHVRDGYSIYTGDEGALNCHGFAWGNDGGYSDAALKGNTLFHVAVKQGLYDEGNVEELPGAPMCGCVEQMPVVTKAGCTKTDVVQTVTVNHSPASKFVVSVDITNIQHEDCGDLSQYYGQLVAHGKATTTELAMLKKHLVGDNQCRVALTEFLASKGLVFL